MSATPAKPIEPHAIPASTAESARESSIAIGSFCADLESPVSLRLDDPRSGQHLEATIPAAAIRLLCEALAQMADGHAVSVLPLNSELSTQQAADAMGVSRPYFVKLLERGDIPFRKVGAQRRVRFEALRRYMAGHETDAAAAVSAMAAEGQRMGLYE